MNKQFLKIRMEEVINTNALITDINDFLVTHVPFKQLKYCPSGISNSIGRIYSEEQLFNEFIMENKSKHNFLVIQGDNGSGKSHFIRWLKYKYDNELNDDSEVAILIERDNNTLQATIKQLLDNNIIRKFVGQDQLDKLSEAESNISTEKFLTSITLAFANEVMHEDDEDCILAERHRKRLYAFLTNEIVIRELMLVENGPIYRMGKKISGSDEKVNLNDDIRFTEKDFAISLSDRLMVKLSDEQDNIDRKAMAFAEALVDDNRGIRKKTAEYLNSKIDQVIQNAIKLNSKDLKNILDKIRVELKKVNKTLTLFIEDITSFTGIDKALIENLIHEHTSENNLCRLFSIVGITNGYYQNSLPDNLKDRVTGRIIIDKESIFEDEYSILEIAARYINAINLEKDIIKEWVVKGASESELPIVKPKNNWSTFEDVLGRRFSIYPFNKQAIRNLFETLEYKTPRMFIKNVLYPMLNKFTDDKGVFPPPVQEFNGLIKVPKFTDELIAGKIDAEIKTLEKERTKAILRIWGDGTINIHDEDNIHYIGGVEEDIFDEFKVPKIAGVITSNKKEKAPSIVSEDTKNERKLIDDINIKNQPELNNSLKKSVVNEVKSKEDKEYKLFLDDLSSWKENKTPLKSHAKVREYLVNFIKEAICWDMEGISSYLVNECLNRNNINIEDQNSITAVSENSFVIGRSDENYYFLIALVKYNIIGKRKWNYEGAVEGILIASKWIEKNKESIKEYIRKNANDEYDIYNYALINNYYLEVIQGNSDLNSLSGVYNGLIKKEMDINEDKLIQVLGDRYIDFTEKKDEFIDNNSIVLRYYNCKLGDVDINTTKVFFLDAKEILMRISNMSRNKWKLSTEINIKDKSEKLLLPYRIYNKFFESKLDELVDITYSEVMHKVDKYKLIVGEERDLKSLISEIANLFKNLQQANIFFEPKIYEDFKALYLEKYVASKVIEDLEISKNKSTISKITILKSNHAKLINYYLSCINNILKLANTVYKDNENKANQMRELNESLENTHEMVNNTISEIKLEISRVNGGK